MVVPVNRLDVPAERPQLRLEVAERDDLLRRLVGLHLVAVDDDPEPPETLVRGCLERFPVLALLELPVPGHHDDTSAATERALRERDPARLGDAHPERPRARLDPRHADIRMTVEPIEAAQSQETLARDDPERVERRVQPRDVVTLGGEEDVPLGILEPPLRHVELLEQEVGDEVQRAERGAQVARACALHGDEGVQPASIGEEREARVAIDVCAAETIELSPGDEAQIRHGRDGSARAPRRSRAARTRERRGRRTPRPRRRRATWRRRTRSAAPASAAGHDDAARATPDRRGDARPAAT